MVVTLVRPLHDSVVVLVECEKESEEVFHMLLIIILANKMTFVLLLYCNLSICIATIYNIKLKTKLMIIVLLVCV